MGIRPEDGSLYFTSDFWSTSPLLFLFLIIPQAWTLGLELTFYLIAPFILKKGFKIVVALILLSIALRLYIYNYLGLQQDPWTYRFFPTEVMFFFTGYLSYRLYVKFKYVSIPRSVNISILVFMLASTMLYQYLPATKINYLPFSLKDLTYFILISCSIPFLFKFLKKNKLDTKVGELSYPVYIAHLSVALLCKAAPVGLSSKRLGNCPHHGDRGFTIK
jgi:peptidoglycan/LPS O-acetylase OafA/YrhL